MSLGRIADKGALILDRRTFDNVENCNTRDSILSLQKQGNSPNANRSTQAVPDQLHRASMEPTRARPDWEAHQKRGTRSRIGEYGRQEAHKIADEGHYIEVRVNVRRWAFGNWRSFSCERVMALSESAVIKQLSPTYRVSLHQMLEHHTPRC